MRMAGLRCGRDRAHIAAGVAGIVCIVVIIMLAVFTFCIAVFLGAGMPVMRCVLLPILAVAMRMTGLRRIRNHGVAHDCGSQHEALMKHATRNDTARACHRALKLTAGNRTAVIRYFAREGAAGNLCRAAFGGVHIGRRSIVILDVGSIVIFVFNYFAFNHGIIFNGQIALAVYAAAAHCCPAISNCRTAGQLNGAARVAINAAAVSANMRAGTRMELNACRTAGDLAAGHGEGTAVYDCYTTAVGGCATEVIFI